MLDSSWVVVLFPMRADIGMNVLQCATDHCRTLYVPKSFSQQSKTSPCPAIKESIALCEESPTIEVI